MFVMAVLIVTTIIVPYRLAFIDVEPIQWIVTYYVFDFIFLIDITICFFTSFKDEVRQVEITSHKLIAKNYLKGWFFLDFSSIFPFDAILDGNANLNNLVRVARIGKMYKVIRLLRLIKVLKLVK